MKTMRMVLFAAVAFLPAIAFADMCSSVAKTYDDRILGLQGVMNRALSVTTDPAERQAILMTYDNAVNGLPDGLLAQKTAALISAGCSPDVAPPPPPPPVDPTSTPTPTPPPAPVPVPPTPDPVTPPVVVPDPVTPPVTVPPTACKDQLDVYGALLKSQHVCPADYLRKMQAKSHELGCDGGSSCHHASDCDGHHNGGSCNHNNCHHASDCDRHHNGGSCNHNNCHHSSDCDRHHNGGSCNHNCRRR